MNGLFVQGVPQPLPHWELGRAPASQLPWVHHQWKYRWRIDNMISGCKLNKLYLVCIHSNIEGFLSFGWNPANLSWKAPIQRVFSWYLDCVTNQLASSGDESSKQLWQAAFKTTEEEEEDRKRVRRLEGGLLLKRWVWMLQQQQFYRNWMAFSQLQKNKERHSSVGTMLPAGYFCPLHEQEAWSCCYLA